MELPESGIDRQLCLHKAQLAMYNVATMSSSAESSVNGGIDSFAQYTTVAVMSASQTLTFVYDAVLFPEF
jgi:hypothetical protein